MAAQILDGKAISAELRGAIAQRVARLREKGVTPGLAVILVGADPASQIYVRNKSVGCDQVGIHSVTINLPETTTQDELEKLIARLNADDTIHGILVQLPLPKHLDEAAALAVIAPEKDVDGFHLLNAGRMMSGQPGVVACTPKGAMEMIRRTGIDLDGKEAVVVGRSNIVGKPMAMLLLQANCTVTICHSHTVNLAQHTRNADILVAAVGKPGFITKSMVKPGAVVADAAAGGNSRVAKLNIAAKPAHLAACERIDGNNAVGTHKLAHAAYRLRAFNAGRAQNTGAHHGYGRKRREILRKRGFQVPRDDNSVGCKRPDRVGSHGAVAQTGD